MRSKGFSKVLLAFIVFYLTMLACGSSAPKTADDYIKEYGGSAEVYQRILSLNDCSSLQKEFDQADANTKIQSPGTPQYKWSLGYMAAADDRMKVIGCYNGAVQQSVNATATRVQIPPSSTSYILPTLTHPATAPIESTVIPTNTIIYIFPTASTPSLGGNCNPYYPDICINDHPRLNCDELRSIGISNFRALSPDPLGYDRDGDSIGCDK